MAKIVSVPEKTLEHWASIYLSNRFPNAAMWWPVDGEDIALELLRGLTGVGPGKPLCLELKTTLWNPSSGRHELHIRTHQLDRYLSTANFPMPVYYCFPVPHWSGYLRSTRGGMPSGPTGYTLPPPSWWRRAARDEWFGEWMYVLPAKEVARILKPGWAGRIRNTKTQEKVFALKPEPFANGSRLGWRATFTHTPPGSSFPEPMRWPDFWGEVQVCGPTAGIRWRTHARDLDIVRVTGPQVNSRFSRSGLLADLAATSDEPASYGAATLLLHIAERDLRQRRDA